MHDSELPSIPAELRQACWRLLLNGNPHWVAYPRRGDSQRQCAVGDITFNGTDFRNYAALPYLFTAALVDDHRLGFGFWSRSRQGEYRWAAHDIEAGAQGRKTSAAQALGDAQAAYAAHLEVAGQRPHALWTLLEESTPGHYHVWTIFARPLSQEDHDAFLLAVTRRTGNLVCLDKTTARAKRGLGDQIRAPWSWKKDCKSVVLAHRLQDAALALELAQATAPVCADPEARLQELAAGRLRAGACGHRSWTAADNSGATVAALTGEMVERYPITGPGQRDKATAQVTLSLLNKGVTAATVTKVTDAWLEHYAPLIATPLEAAKREGVRCRDRTIRRLDDGELSPCAPGRDHWAFLRMHRDSLPAFDRFVNGRWAGRQFLPAMGRIPPSGDEKHCPSLHEEEGCSDSVQEDGQAARRDGFSDYDKPFVTALLLWVLHKALQTDEGVLRLTDGQWLETVRLVTGQPPPDWRQLRRFKARFVTRKQGSKRRKAEKWELLGQTVRGRRQQGSAKGIPSQYRVTGLGLAFDLLLDDPASVALLRDEPASRPLPAPCEWDDPDEGFSLPSEDPLAAWDGPESSWTAGGPEEGNGSPRRPHSRPE